MKAPRTLQTLDRDGNPHEFELTCEHDFESGREYWLYRVRRLDLPEFFEGRFCALGADRVESVMLDAHTVYGGKGIPEALFDVVARDLGRTLVSSRTRGVGREENEFRSVDAEKMWKRIVRAGTAIYEPTEDRYIFKPK